MEEPELKSLRELVNDLVKDVKSVKSALLGDEYNPVGYIRRLELVEKAQDKFETNCDTHKAEMEKYKNRLLGGALVIGFIWTVAVAVIGIYLSSK